MIESVMGVIGFGEANEIVDKVLFPKDPKETAERLRKSEIGKIIDEVETLVERLRNKGFTIFVFESPEIARNVHEKLHVEVDVAKPSEAGELLRTNLEKFAIEMGFVKTEAELRDWIHEVTMELTKIRVRMAVEKRDLVVAQAIQTLDDVDKTVNLFMGRLREWYGLHFPELDRLLEKHETYARLILKLGTRDNLTAENLEKEGIPKTKAQAIAETANASMGAELIEEDLNQILSMSKNALELYDRRQSLENYIDSTMDEVAPNTRTLVGALLGARIIALAGGLINLAKMPASTVQVLGAEKALFRALKTGTPPPKHGIIFQHTIIHEAKQWQRGKLARALAGKLAIAARTDAFSGKYCGDKLKADLERRTKEIQEKYEEPPQVKKPSFKEPHRKPFRRKNRGRRR